MRRPAAELDKLQAKLEKAQAELAELEKARVDRAGQPAAPVSGGRVVRLAPRPLFLTGREGLLAELAARLGGEGSKPRVVLHGC